MVGDEPRKFEKVVFEHVHRHMRDHQFVLLDQIGARLHQR